MLLVSDLQNQLLFNCRKTPDAFFQYCDESDLFDEIAAALTVIKNSQTQDNRDTAVFALPITDEMKSFLLNEGYYSNNRIAFFLNIFNVLKLAKYDGLEELTQKILDLIPLKGNPAVANDLLIQFCNCQRVSLENEVKVNDPSLSEEDENLGWTFMSKISFVFDFISVNIISSYSNSYNNSSTVFSQ
jgi:hypothetical protein